MLPSCEAFFRIHLSYLVGVSRCSQYHMTSYAEPNTNTTRCLLILQPVYASLAFVSLFGPFAVGALLFRALPVNRFRTLLFIFVCFVDRFAVYYGWNTHDWGNHSLFLTLIAYICLGIAASLLVILPETTLAHLFVSWPSASKGKSPPNWFASCVAGAWHFTRFQPKKCVITNPSSSARNTISQKYVQVGSKLRFLIAKQPNFERIFPAEQSKRAFRADTHIIIYIVAILNHWACS